MQLLFIKIIILEESVASGILEEFLAMGSLFLPSEIKLRYTVLAFLLNLGNGAPQSIIKKNLPLL
jgi:hypothetical protein